jgi:hypothetical protein
MPTTSAILRRERERGSPDRVGRHIGIPQFHQRHRYILGPYVIALDWIVKAESLRKVLQVSPLILVKAGASKGLSRSRWCADAIAFVS